MCCGTRFNFPLHWTMTRKRILGRSFNIASRRRAIFCNMIKTFTVETSPFIQKPLSSSLVQMRRVRSVAALGSPAPHLSPAAPTPASLRPSSTPKLHGVHLHLLLVLLLHMLLDWLLLLDVGVTEDHQKRYGLHQRLGLRVGERLPHMIVEAS